MAKEEGFCGVLAHVHSMVEPLHVCMIICCCKKKNLLYNGTHFMKCLSPEQSGPFVDKHALTSYTISLGQSVQSVQRKGVCVCVYVCVCVCVCMSVCVCVHAWMRACMHE